MGGYKIFFKQSVARDCGEIPPRDLQRIMVSICRFAGNPRPAGCERLTGRNRYRLRLGRYRVSYTIRDEASTVCVVKVAHRRQAYR